MTQRRDAGVDDAELERRIVAEVAKQLKPFLDMLTRAHDWQLSFWSNGSDRPPGFFQSRMKEDDERNRQVKKDLADQNSKLEPIVAFINEQRILKEHRSRRWKFWWPKIQWALGGFATSLLALVAWLGPHVVHVVDILWQDYEHYHPGLSDQIKKAYTGINPAVSSGQKPQETAAP